MATKRVIELDERTALDMNDYLLVDSQTSTRKLAMSTLFNYMTLTTMIFVTELPTEDISESTIYLLPHSGSNTQWDEYVYRDGAWVIIGTSTIDLSSIYQTKTDNSLNTTSKQIVGAINEVNNELNDTGKWELVATLSSSSQTLSLSSYKAISFVTFNSVNAIQGTNEMSVELFTACAGLNLPLNNTDHVVISSTANDTNAQVTYIPSNYTCYVYGII